MRTIEVLNRIVILDSKDSMPDMTLHQLELPGFRIYKLSFGPFKVDVKILDLVS